MKVALVAVPTIDQTQEMTIADDGLRPVGADVIRPCPPYGIYLLAGVLEASGHEVSVIDLIADGRGRLDPTAHAGFHEFELVGISATSLSWAAARRAIEHVRRVRPHVPIVAGGVHASQFDRWVLEHSGASMVIRGDGEQPLAQLCRVLESHGDLSTVPSLTWRNGDGDIVRNADGNKVLAADLTRWFPSYDQLPHRAYFGLALETSRGCAFACSFCSTPHRRRWRGGEPAAVVDRLERLVPYLGRTITPSVYLVDDEFTMNPARAMSIASDLGRRSLPLSILYDSRAPDLLRPGLVETLAPHTRSLLVGAECGYDEGLARIGKGTTCEVLNRAAAELAKAGIARRADFSFILGLPWEGPREVRRTVEFAFGLAERHGVRLLFNWYAQIPGSELWDEARASGAIHESRYDDFGVQRDPAVFFRATRLTRAEIEEIAALVRDRRATIRGRAPTPEFSLPPALRFESEGKTRAMRG